MNDKKTSRLTKKIASKTQSIKNILGNLYEAKSKEDSQMVIKG